METLTTVPILVALAMGLTLTTGFHVVYKANAHGHGLVEIAPWRQRLSAAVAHVTGWGATIAAIVRTRQQLIAATLALALCLAYPSADTFAGLTLIGVAGTLNIAAMERDLLKKSGEAASLLEKTAKECQAYQEKDKDEKVVVQGRLMTADEKQAIQALIDEGNVLKAKIATAKGDANLSAEIEKLTAGMAARRDPGQAAARVTKSLGQQYIESAAYAFAKAKASGRATNWQADGVELMAATLDETVGSGGDLIVTQYQPGILPLLFKRLVVADLLAKGQTDSSSVTYLKETTFTNAAAAVAEGSPKPESTLIFDQVVDAVAKIAHWLPVTDEMLEDVSQIKSYIDARLKLGVELAEEDQLLNGSGTAPNMQGLLNRSGLTTATVRAGSVTNADAIFTAMMAVFNASFVMPTGTIMNPLNWQTTVLSKDGNGNYYGAGPFAGPQAMTLWGLPVVVTPSIVANTGFTGAFSSAAQMFRKGGIRVEASNSHSDFFVRNLTAIRAEERAALAVYRPAAFSKITSLT